MQNSSTKSETLLAKLNAETAKISWRELQRFFASGKAIYVDSTLDLIHTASLMVEDDTAQLKPLMDAQQFAPVSDQQAEIWYEQDENLWAVVVSPWVLVQEQKK
ncbi:DUF2288 domain-containing protein [Teredinibacter sp. KSP-S5-2]|uniref:DUF2288 domain-containing protein n=1 Tax=Teredinibacter sp. KSP-S5-2 TaxID=3034506 RepID=UPI0029352A45|nr:DUF2288 domain-containing protein [Teredinibacter sp. KSP-S5-2]WNO10102.1 DUF2288 domain-containing protein [Teredinibacter sp. KSP-S5-2]